MSKMLKTSDQQRAWRRPVKRKGGKSTSPREKAANLECPPTANVFPKQRGDADASGTKRSPPRTTPTRDVRGARPPGRKKTRPDGNLHLQEGTRGTSSSTSSSLIKRPEERLRNRSTTHCVARDTCDTAHCTVTKSQEGKHGDSAGKSSAQVECQAVTDGRRPQVASHPRRESEDGERADRKSTGP